MVFLRQSVFSLIHAPKNMWLWKTLEWIISFSEEEHVTSLEENRDILLQETLSQNHKTINEKHSQSVHFSF